MEMATFSTMEATDMLFQFQNESIYYVNHLSAFEHAIRKTFGFNISEDKSRILALSALQGECQLLDNLLDNSTTRFAVVPFFSGKPPNITSNFEVISKGQGNSMVSGKTKAMQCLATLCSCLKHFSFVVIGVVLKEDIDLLQSMVNKFYYIYLIYLLT
jgi:hypothetical protein